MLAFHINNDVLGYFYFFFSLSLRRFLEFVFEAFVVAVLEVEQRCTGEKRSALSLV